MNRISKVRPSPIAGTWYSDNPDFLEQSINDYKDLAELPELPGEVIALVAPHAGYRYSGMVAGFAYKTVYGKSFDTVVIVSPMHQYHPQPLLTSAHQAYETPLGEIPLNVDKLAQINETLLSQSGLSLTPVANDQEHSLEIQLPFLQVALNGDFNLIPIMLRDQTPENARILGQALAETLQDESCLMIASTDLSHFYPEQKANQLDRQVLQAIEDFSPGDLFALKNNGQGHACGLAAVAAVLWAAQSLGADKATLLHYATSAAVTGDHSSVVGYGSAAITRPD